MNNFKTFRHFAGFKGLLFVFQLREFKVIGREVPTDKVKLPPLYQMRIFASDKCVAKSRFWYFVGLLKKMKKTRGEIVHCQQVCKNHCCKSQSKSLILANNQHMYIV